LQHGCIQLRRDLPSARIDPLDSTTKKQRLTLLAEICHERGLACTAQRRAVYEALLDLDDHPSADRVHEMVARRIPEVNRTTVYRSLEFFVELGLITKVCHPGRAVRYDPRVGIHHHLVCLRCDEILDFDDPRLDALPIPDTSKLDFEIADFRVQLRGLCGKCRLEKKS
jgi:Fur family peroxide stress response transcriptional regulator